MKRDAIMKELGEVNEAMQKRMTHELFERGEELRAAYRQILFDEKLAAGDVADALCLCGSEEVAGAIAKLAPALPTDLLRDILRDEWTRCEAHRPFRAEFVEMFRRVGFITDTADLPREVLSGTATVYRGNLGEPEPAGISWTLDEARAGFFSNHGMSVRGRFLGLYRSDGQPTVWQGTVNAVDILAYFDGRNEQEVVLDPATVRDCKTIAQAESGGEV